MAAEVALHFVLIPKSNEKQTQAGGGMHAAHTSAQNCSIFPSNKQLDVANEHMLLQF